MGGKVPSYMPAFQPILIPGVPRGARGQYPGLIIFTASPREYLRTA
jgi:hypothetical protein